MHYALGSARLLSFVSALSSLVFVCFSLSPSSVLESHHCHQCSTPSASTLCSRYARLTLHVSFRVRVRLRLRARVPTPAWRATAMPTLVHCALWRLALVTGAARLVALSLALALALVDATALWSPAIPTLCECCVCCALCSPRYDSFESSWSSRALS